MSDTTTTTTAAVTDDRAKAETFTKALFWIGPACFILAFAAAAWASEQYNGSSMTLVAYALVFFGGLSMLLWVVVNALDSTRPR